MFVKIFIKITDYSIHQNLHRQTFAPYGTKRKLIHLLHLFNGKNIFMYNLTTGEIFLTVKFSWTMVYYCTNLFCVFCSY